MSNQVDKITSLAADEDGILSRGQLEMLEDDPSKMETLARLMGAVNLDNLFRQMQCPTVGLAVKIEFQKMLNKMGRLEPEKASTGSGGPQVIVNITRAKVDSEGLVIESSVSDGA